TRSYGDWSSDVCSSDLSGEPPACIAGRGEQSLAERAARASERDPLEALAIVAAGQAPDMPIADDAGLEEPHRAGGDVRARPSREIGRASCRERVEGAGG